MDTAILDHVFASLDAWIERWDNDKTLLPPDEVVLLQEVLELHRYNYILWHYEDIARRKDVDAETIADVKRDIDKANQKRNDTIERIDEWLFTTHYNSLSEQLPLRTETPGSVFDRLSILALKVSHMREQTKRTGVEQSHIDACRQKLVVLLQQQRGLQQSLIEMFTDLDNGKIRMKVYRQFKMYNDPSLNPQVYEKRARKQTKDG
jgi:hypothetical protein